MRLGCAAGLKPVDGYVEVGWGQGRAGLQCEHREVRSIAGRVLAGLVLASKFDTLQTQTHVSCCHQLTSEVQAAEVGSQLRITQQRLHDVVPSPDSFQGPQGPLQPSLHLQEPQPKTGTQANDLLASK